MEARNLADLYDLPIVDWARIRDRLDQGIDQAPGTAPGREGPDRHTCWLATINPDGSPHVTGVGALWVDGEFWFETGERSRKGRNLARDPRCTLSVATHDFDLVVEGNAVHGAGPRHRGRHGGALGGAGLAGDGRRIGDGADRRVQRTLGRTTAVARVPAGAPRRHRARHRRTRRRHPLPLLGRARPRVRSGHRVWDPVGMRARWLIVLSTVAVLLVGYATVTALAVGRTGTSGTTVDVAEQPASVRSGRTWQELDARP